MANELDGKIAVITGAASGIGLATTEAMIDAGATVVMVDRDAGAIMDASEIAEAVIFILSRKRTVTVHDVIVLPTALDA